MSGRYVKIDWPDSQDYMDEDWFEEEAVPDLNDEGAYLIPEEYVHKPNTQK
jgi:hypothetical protein